MEEKLGWTPHPVAAPACHAHTTLYGTRPHVDTKLSLLSREEAANMSERSFNREPGLDFAAANATTRDALSPTVIVGTSDRTAEEAGDAV